MASFLSGGRGCLRDHGICVLSLLDCLSDLSACGLSLAAVETGELPEATAGEASGAV